MMQHTPMQPQQQVVFDFVQSEMQANNYLVSPGYTVYLLDKTNGVLYEKTFGMMEAYELKKKELYQNQNGSGSAITREEISQMIADALRQYNPHIPKKERTNG